MLFKNVALVVLLGVLLSSSARAEVAIAVVDLQQALNTTEEGKSIKNSLKSEGEQKQQQLSIMESDLKKMQEDIQKQRMTLSEAALKQKMEEFKQKYTQLQQKAVEFEKELQRKEAENADRILGGLQENVAQIAQSKGYTLVLEKSRGAVVYATAAIPDITSDVIAAYNKNPAKKKK